MEEFFVPSNPALAGTSPTKKKMNVILKFLPYQKKREMPFLQDCDKFICDNFLDMTIKQLLDEMKHTEDFIYKSLEKMGKTVTFPFKGYMV